MSDAFAFLSAGMADSSSWSNNPSSQLLSIRSDLKIIENKRHRRKWLHPRVLYDVFVQNSAESANCLADSPEVVKYVSTTSVSRDMLEMLEKGGWKRMKYWG